MINNSETNISLVGKSGKEYYGKMYDKNSDSSLSGEAIVCLSNILWRDNHWQYNIRDIYSDASATAVEHFKARNDISHLILIPVDDLKEKDLDAIDDLRRQYIHT